MCYAVYGLSYIHQKLVRCTTALNNPINFRIFYQFLCLKLCVRSLLDTLYIQSSFFLILPRQAVIVLVLHYSLGFNLTRGFIVNICFSLFSFLYQNDCKVTGNISYCVVQNFYSAFQSSKFS